MTYADAVEVALCFGWIDGIRKSLDATSYVNRFTPRKADSVWSQINIARVEALIARGEMHQSGLDAYAKRDPAKSGIYSFEQRPQSFPPELERRFRTAKGAWTHFNAQPPGYRRLAIWWVSSAKREETRLRRLSQLIEVSGQGMRIGALFGQTGAVPTPSPQKAKPKPKAKTKAGAPGPGPPTNRQDPFDQDAPMTMRIGVDLGGTKIEAMAMDADRPRVRSRAGGHAPPRLRRHDRGDCRAGRPARAAPRRRRRVGVGMPGHRSRRRPGW